MAETKKKIVLVDDEIDFLEIMKTRFVANDYIVKMTSNGSEALELVRKEKPDAVMLDILMPGIDGLDILKKIRAENPRIPIFMMTAFSNEERRDIANRFNASDFILKTNDLQSEIDKITSAIDISSRNKK